MGNVIDIKRVRRRVGQKWTPIHRPWWRLWFWPPTMPLDELRRLAPEELRRGSAWGPAVDRGRQSGADLSLIHRPVE
jgi:hypothetical protein